MKTKLVVQIDGVGNGHTGALLLADGWPFGQRYQYCHPRCSYAAGQEISPSKFWRKVNIQCKEKWTPCTEDDPGATPMN
jgi:hypothetical protein